VADMEEKVMEGLDLSAVKEEYAGKWVALSRDYRTVFASADSLQSLLKKSDIPEQVVMQVLPPPFRFAFLRWTSIWRCPLGMSIRST